MNTLARVITATAKSGRVLTVNARDMWFMSAGTIYLLVDYVFKFLYTKCQPCLIVIDCAKDEIVHIGPVRATSVAVALSIPGLIA